MEGQVVGRELTRRRAARRADLVPTIGAAVGLVMAGSWTSSGNEVGGQQPRREDETAHPCEHRAGRAASLVRGTLEHAPGRIADPARAVSRVAREARAEDEQGLVSGPISTRTMTVFQHPARRPASLVRGTLERAPRRFAHSAM